MSDAGVAAEAGHDRRRVGVVLAALFLSGVAGIANQVAWQRALKIFLGSTESLSSLVVVLVFMLGLGLGAGLMGGRAARFVRPATAFGWIEVLLCAVNLLIAGLLSLDLSETVFAAQRVALSAGIPLRAVYAVGALGVLLPPTVLMGATLPVASEACQRQFGATRRSLITVLFFLNTGGAVVGAFGASFYMLPTHGQRATLLAAAAFNLAAGLLLLGATRTAPDAAPAPVRSGAGSRRLSLEEILGFGLGFLSLGYEIFLFRVMALAHEPLPVTFATTLCFFLLFWSVGVYLAPRVRSLTPVFVAVIVLVAAMPAITHHDRTVAHFGVFGGALVYYLPCAAFGLLYGVLVSRSAHHWGEDVGRFYALNTLGSCLGVGFFTLVGYELPQTANAALIAVGLLGLWLAMVMAERGPDAPRRGLLRGAVVACAVVWLGISLWGWSQPWTRNGEVVVFWGRDGVVEVHPNGDLLVDGLWHSALTNGQNHIGLPYSWMMVFGAVFTRQDRPIVDALVIGNGVGLTASTLALLDGVQVDAYEINHTIRDVIDAFPTETLDIATNDKVDIQWTDARSGLALNPKRYDVIISAPLHLSQAGSSILLSQEYLQLVRSRLKPGGVVAIYSHEGYPEQSLLVRATIASVFDHTATFLQGILTVASDDPLTLSQTSIAARLARDDPYYRQVAAYDRHLRSNGIDGVYATFDQVRLSTDARGWLITDDHPLVEYPDVARALIGATAPSP